ncbi:hypothetical protein HYPSUDRAFT_43186 [Hypholoma sublateritium FD-334 SS-4]|uniref:Uncharacterized protein n=1 Tax=Hypholoma sublateritium (strain FD-334 SS-4) TaxID=945553 RepID=A0A0D2NVB3_HYPSF|nr:hypothetical protein HYPSUDRAFT_43186 [Hypholoma sublateritium FD-334 SS-4]
MSIFDDRDASWTYTGDWAKVSEFPALDETVHLSAGTDGIAEFSFSGVGVSVFGTVASLGFGLAPRASFVVDGGPESIYVPPQESGTTQYQHLFFQSDVLPAGDHTLTIKNLLASGRLYLDYASVQAATATPPAAPTPGQSATSTTANSPPATPTAPASTSVTSTTSPAIVTTAGSLTAPGSSVTSSSSSLSVSGRSQSTETASASAAGTVAEYTTTFDDRDPSIVYTGTWNAGGYSSEYEGTDTWTNTTGASASITFTGIGISVCGTIGALGNGIAPQSSYSIDGGAQTDYTAVQQAGAQYKQCFFRSATLASAIHTLVIGNTADGGNYYMDYISVVSLNPNAVTSPTGFSSVATTTDSPSSSKSSPVGAIVGGILGALLVIGLAIAGVLYMRRKRGVHTFRVEGATSTTQIRFQGGPRVVTPFVPLNYTPHGSDHSESGMLGGRSTSHSNSGWSNLAVGTSHKRTMSTLSELPPPQYE